MAITVPSAEGIEAMLWGDSTPSNTNERQPVGDLAGYVPADPAAADSTLTVRDGQFATPQVVERSRWSLDSGLVVMNDGFQAGRIYRVSYRAKALPMSGLGLGLAPVREAASWVKYAPGALASAKQTLAFGSSQSGRFLRAFQPKTFFTNTSVEYWGGGRNAALVHTSPDGTRDLALAANTHVYYLSGAQHGPARFRTSVGNEQQPDNPLEYWWTMRALMAGMEQWLLKGTPPPASRFVAMASLCRSWCRRWMGTGTRWRAYG